MKNSSAIVKNHKRTEHSFRKQHEQHCVQNYKAVAISRLNKELLCINLKIILARGLQLEK